MNDAKLKIWFFFMSYIFQIQDLERLWVERVTKFMRESSQEYPLLVIGSVVTTFVTCPNESIF